MERILHDKETRWKIKKKLVLSVRQCQESPMPDGPQMIGRSRCLWLCKWEFGNAGCIFGFAIRKDPELREHRYFGITK